MSCTTDELHVLLLNLALMDQERRASAPLGRSACRSASASGHNEWACTGPKAANIVRRLQRSASVVWTHIDPKPTPASERSQGRAAEPSVTGAVLVLFLD
ncbi:hypothetical protein [Amycolatopsis pithecellobii]|uniref:Uncharacterized protein n=1 Tax=Amycolatopsis pithecellobii TaxID=664692 RepID=A0A6N7YTF0_9PSEU|nr:hypothetical protein [Amycolatopsis pithecellobii]MTD55212.1 hypothetical protein [Amycolatopsis pithecellobii]